MYEVKRAVDIEFRTAMQGFEQGLARGVVYGGAAVPDGALPPLVTWANCTREVSVHYSTTGSCFGRRRVHDQMGAIHHTVHGCTAVVM